MRLTFIILFLTGFSLISSAQVNESDSTALIDFYNATDGNNWQNNDGWLVDAIGNWYGITTENNRVTEIELPGNELKGNVPESFGNLSALINLNLSNDSLYGILPESFWNLTNLEELNLRYNSLESQLPEQIGLFTNLTFLQLEGNQFYGEIPPEIGLLTNLQILDIENNSFENIPDEMGLLTNLQGLNIRGNGFSGSFPDTLFNLTNLFSIRITNNEFTGEIPDRIQEWTQLHDLDFGENDFSGPIPDVLGNMTTLGEIHLQGNNLTGNIPMNLWNLENLFGIEIGRNQLSGEISNDIAKLKNLQKFNVRENNFYGHFPDSILGLPQINELWITDNNFVSLPDLTQLEEIEEIDISYNKLTFEDLEPLMGANWSYFNYEPQKDVYDVIDTTLAINDTLIMNAAIGGSNNSYQWYFNGEQIPGANASSYTFLALSEDLSGEYHCEISSSLVPIIIYRSSININIEDNAGINDLSIGKIISVYPNPAIDEVKIIREIADISISYQILSIDGQLVKQGSFESARNEVSIDISNLNTGMYFINFMSREMIGVTKLIVE